MIDYEGFKKYLEINLPKSANSYVSGLRALVTILNTIDDFKNLEDEDKIFMFLNRGNEFKEEFDTYHERNKDTFSDSRSFVNKYKEFLQNKNSMGNDRKNLKQIIKNFVNKWNNTDELWKNEFLEGIKPIYRDYKLKISFGQGKRVSLPNFPYISFLKYNQKVSKGVYPYIQYEHNIKKLVTGLGLSKENIPEIPNNIVEKIKQYPQNDYGLDDSDIELLIDKLDENIDIFEQFFHNAKNIKNYKVLTNIKNIILYGPPGVGKTHNTNKLIKLIEDGKSQQEIFESIQNNENYELEEFDNDLKRRIKFVTFHQSFGYEDFIEGFRPNDNGQIELEDGIFKQITLEAKRNQINSNQESKFNLEQFLSDYIEKVEQEDKYFIDNKLQIEVKKDKNGEFKSFIASGRIKGQSLAKGIIERDLEKFINGNIEKPADIKPTFESNQKQHGNAPYYYLLFEDMKKFYLENRDKYKKDKETLKNYYLIIDEINRGNISKIFGELITLIEEDKRDKLEVVLPYSKEPFSVPSNLFIIGTMNSSDKSIALIDIALRRRFTFLKMKPNEELVPDIARDYFIELNSKIEEKFGSDFKIGHSYFMDIDTQEDFEFIKKYKIKPLLEEYFYGDSENLKDILEKI